MSVVDAPRRFLTLDQVAEQLQLSRRTIERLVAAEILPSVKVSPGAIRVDPADLAEWLARSTVGAGSSAGVAAPAVGTSSSVEAGASLPSRPRPQPRTPETQEGAGSRARAQRAGER